MKKEEGKRGRGGGKREGRRELREEKGRRGEGGGKEKKKWMPAGKQTSTKSA